MNQPRRCAPALSQNVEADVVAHIAEVDERRLYAREAFPSMFAYCTDVLHLSEAEAYLALRRPERRGSIRCFSPCWRMAVFT